MKGTTMLEETGTGPQPWSSNLYEANATGEIALEDDPVTKRNALVLRNLEGAPSIQFYTWQHIDLPPGRYEFRFDYMTGGDAGGELFLNFKGDREKMSVPMPASKGVWKRSFTIMEVTGAGIGISPQFRATGAGAANALYLRNISMRRLQDKK
jgi:hypothetical protein